MTPAYRDWIDKAKAVTLDTILSKRSIELTERHGELVGPCPICGGDDRFAVHVKKGVFNCRGCGKGGGGAIDLVMFLDKANFEQAVETITGSPPPKEDKRSKGGGKKSNGASNRWSPVVARYVYRQADGTPYLQVCRTAAKTFFQNHWNGQMWVSGKPTGPKIPYRLPELIAAPITAKVHITEGEKDSDALAQLGFVATTNSEGAAHWTDDLKSYFKDRHVFIHEDNDEEGRKRVQRIARVLDPIAASVRVIRLPGLAPNGDVSDWLKDDPSGARLVRECESAPLWEPSMPAPDEEAHDDEAGTGVDLLIKKKQADILIELASAAELFHDRDDLAYARFDVNGHKENWPLRSKGFKRWLARGFYESTQSAPSSDAMQAAMNVLEARAQFDAPEHEVHVRIAGCHDDCIYVDLADRDWRAIEIDQGGWRIVDSPPVYFRRSSGMKPLPEPIAGGSLKDDLRPLLNVKTDDEFVLTVAWLLAALRPSGPYPAIAFAGENGSSKTMRCNFMRALVDPNSVPLRALPRNEHDLYIAARNSHVLGYDNASGLPDWLSDAFCRLATGGGFSTRQLYTDDDEILFGSKRPILLNGIDDVATRPDLADRSIVQTLAAISDERRKLETDLWEEFERRRPRILGALLTAVSHGLKILPDVKLDRKPRMADFAVWASACEGALWNKGTFMAAYTANITEAVETVLEADQVATALRGYVNSMSEFEGTATDLLKALNGVVSESQQKAKGWPKRPANLGKMLRRIAAPLRKIGMDITFEREGKPGARNITIKHQPVTPPYPPIVLEGAKGGVGSAPPPSNTREGEEGDADTPLAGGSKPHRVILACWKKAIGVGQARTLQEAIAIADGHAGFKAALLVVAPLGRDDAVSNVLLARRLRDVNGLEADGLMLEYGGIKDGSPLWTLTNPKHGPRIQSLPSELGHSEKGGKTPSAPSAPSAANQFNDLRLTVDERSPSASPSATSATDKADNAADSANACAASHNPLKNTAADSADGKDGNSHTLTGSHVCAQCRSPPNGKERQYAYGDEAIWLHPWCERDFIKAKMEEQGVRW